MKKTLILILGICLCWACSEKQPESVMVFEVNLKQSPKKDFHEIYKLKEVIPLETTDNSIMGTPMKVIAADDRIFISTWGSSIVYIFNRQGKYLTQINRQGRGPGEYVKLKDFMVTRNPQSVIVYDRNGKLVSYDWEGNFREEVKMPPYLSNVENLPTGGWLTNHGLMQTPKFRGAQYIVRATDAERNDIIGLDTLPYLQYSVPLDMVSSLAQDEGRYYTVPAVENTIYEYNWKDTLFIPRYKFKIADNLLPESGQLTSEDILKGFFAKYYLFCREFIGTKTVLVIATMLNTGEMYTLVADKQTGEVNVFSAYPEDKENEIKLGAYMQHSGFNGHVVLYAAPSTLTDKKFSNQNSIGYRLSKELKEEDNPVLFVYEEK